MAAPLPRPVKSLGLVSLLTDVSSEMIHPLLPTFLTSVLKAGPTSLGLVEGAAETVASALKLFAGRLSDRTARRKPLVVFGYGVSTLARPLMALAASPLHVLGVRLLDRAGKGVRGAPRDALLAAAVPAAERGRAFGFHRAMDHAGATLGPLLASGALLAGADLRTVFALAALPGFLALAVLVFAVEERPRDDAPASEAPPISPSRAGTSAELRRFLAVLALFTLGNSSDAFLLLRAQELGVALVFVPLLWTFHHLVKTGLSTWGGAFSDRAGRRRAIAAGWGVYALAYLGFAFATGPWAMVALFGLYGLFPALTEGPEKALVADLVGTSVRGRAFGAYHAVTGFVVLPGNLLTGWIWETAGAGAALGMGAALAAVAAFLLATAVGEARPDAVPFDRGTPSD